MGIHHKISLNSFIVSKLIFVTLHICMRIGIIGTGTVGSALIDMFIKNKVPISIICSSKTYCKHPTINWRQEMTIGNGMGLMKEMTDVMIDCTANEEISKQYIEWDKHVIAANKKGLSGELNYFKQLMQSSHKIYFESSCGAGLPLIRTLSDMVKSGDELQRIEGVLSGTLSYIFNNFTTSFSDIVLQAKSLGYTEPDPRDDLNGIDVMRKLLILGRVCGLNLEASDIIVNNIVPEALRQVELDDFLSKLPLYDDHFLQLARKATMNQTCLRYVGTLNIIDKSYTVDLNEYPKDHIFSQLKGSDNVVKLISKRFPNGLIIQGSGAGAEVTAFGCYSDYLRLVNE